jgi:hypothetical protein
MKEDEVFFIFGDGTVFWGVNATRHFCKSRDHDLRSSLRPSHSYYGFQLSWLSESLYELKGCRFPPQTMSIIQRCTHDDLEKTAPGFRPNVASQTTAERGSRA